MDPLGHLALATLVFLATHFVTSTPLRASLVEAMGERTYVGTYSLVSFITIAWMSWTFVRAPAIRLWHIPGLELWPAALMPFVTILLAAGYMTRNPTFIGQDKALKSEEPARGIIRVTRHPIMWSVALWAGLHILARGDAASLVFFGGFLLMALAGTKLIDLRKAERLGEDWKRFADLTSNVPFMAIVEGRNRLILREIGWKRVGAGLALYALLVVLHPVVLGSRAY
jgi:uncharacterized membrane protein